MIRKDQLGGDRGGKKKGPDAFASGSGRRAGPRGLSKAAALKTVAAAASKAVAKSLALSAVVLGPGILLLLGGQTIFGMIWLLVGSFGLMAWTYRKPWRVGWVSALLPPGAAALCYLVQYILFGAVSPPIAFVAIAVGLGVAVGFWRANTHVVRRGEDGGIVAERTVGYLFVWLVAYGCTQLFSMIAATVILVRAGLVTGAFTTAMLVVVSWVIFSKGRALKMLALAVVVAGLLLPPGQARADTCSDLKADFAASVRTLLSLTYSSLRVSEGATTFSSETRCQWAMNVQGNSVSGDVFFDLSAFPTPAEAQNWVQRQGGQRIAELGDAGGRYGVSNTPSRSSVAMFSSFGVRAVATQVSVNTRPDLYQRAVDEGLIAGFNSTAVTGLQSLHEAAFFRFSRPEHMRVFVIVSSTLIAAGIAVHVAQAIASAVANAVQAGVEMSAQDIQEAISEALLRRAPATDEPATERSRPPPNVSGSERVRDPSGPEARARPEDRAPEPERSRRPTRFPPIFDPYAQAPFETNDDGQYWAPDSNGNWRWMDQGEARQAASAMSDELKGRRAEQDTHEAEANQDREDWWAGQPGESDRGPTWYETMRAREEARAASASEEAYEDRLREEERARHDREAQENKARERERRQEAYARERAEEARAEAERAKAEADLRSAEDAATRRGDIDILLRTGTEDIYNEDGSLDHDHIRRVREALRGRMGRDLAAPDEDLNDNGWGRVLRETAEETLDEAQDSFVVRGGMGYATGGMSEIWFQGRGTVNAIREAAERAEDEGRDMSFTDGVRIAGQRFAEENLPVETIATATRIARGEEVSVTEIGMSLASDAMALTDIFEGVQRGRTLTGQATDRLETMIDQARRGETGSNLGMATATDRLDSGRLRSDTEAAIERVTTRDGPRHPVDAHHASGRERGAARVEALNQAQQRLELARRDPLSSPEQIAQAQRDVRNEVIRVQGDKHAMNELNARADGKSGDPLIGTFNEEMNQIYGEADAQMRQRLATEYGVRPEDISTVTITNQPGGTGGRMTGEAPERAMGGQASRWTEDGRIEGSRADRSPFGMGEAADAPAPRATDRKAGMDRDLTMRVRVAPGVFEDIPSTVTARIYNEAIYEAATGRPASGAAGGHHASVDFKDTHLTAGQHLADPLDIDDPQAFARRIDQATTDRLHPEAYGTGQGDLETATMDSMRGRDFTDPAVVAKTVEYKVDHWMGEAGRLQEMAKTAETPEARRQLLEQASAHMEEAQRQLGKQYRNLVLRRTAAMDALGRVPGARVPTELAERVGVLERVRAKDPSVRLTPQQAEDVLRSMGTDTKTVARQMSAYVEGLEKLRSPTVTGRPDLSFRRPAMQGWQDDLRGEQKDDA